MKALYLRDVSTVSFAQFVTGLIAFCYTIVTARLLGVAEYGLFQALMGVYGTLSLFSLPLNIATIHCIGATRPANKPKVGGQLLRVATSGGGIFAVAVIFLSSFLSTKLHAASPFPVVAMALLLLFRALLTTLYGILQGNNLHGTFSIWKVIESALCLAVGTALVWFGLGPSGAILGYLAAMAIVFIFLLILERRRYNFQPGFSEVREEFLAIGKIALTFGVLLSIDNIPVVIARSNLTAEMSGLFGCLFNLRNIFIPFAFAVSVPFYSRALSQDQEPHMRWKAIFLVSFLGSIFVGAGLIGPKWAITTLYGPAFGGASPYMAFYGFAIFLQMVSMVVMFDQIASRHFSGFVLGLPLLVFVAVIILGDARLETLIGAQISAWSVYLGATVLRSLLKKGRARG